jgi:DNA polymerase-3 subunit delta'
MGVDDIAGNSPVRAALQRRAAAGRLGHALLLVGPDAVGKTTLARALAQELLDSGAWPGPIDGHPDLWCEDGDGERIGIDRVRAGVEGSLQQFLSLRAYMGGARVAIIARADRLTDQAANALLKTLEEPPPRSHLLLTAASPERLPQTILSRCECVTLAPVPEGDIETWLVAADVAPELAATCARLSAGRPGRARRLAESADELRTELASLHRFLGIAGGGVSAALAAAAELAAGTGAEVRDRLLLQLAVWSAFCRDAACYAAGAPELARWSSHAGVLEGWSGALSAGRAGEILELLLRAAGDIAAYAHPRLTLEVLFLDIFCAAEAPPMALGLPELEPAAAAPPRRPRRSHSGV